AELLQRLAAGASADESEERTDEETGDHAPCHTSAIRPMPHLPTRIQSRVTSQQSATRSRSHNCRCARKKTSVQRAGGGGAAGGTPGSAGRGIDAVARIARSRVCSRTASTSLRSRALSGRAGDETKSALASGGTSTVTAPPTN